MIFLTGLERNNIPKEKISIIHKKYTILAVYFSAHVAVANINQWYNSVVSVIQSNHKIKLHPKLFFTQYSC